MRRAFPAKNSKQETKRSEENVFSPDLLFDLGSKDDVSVATGESSSQTSEHVHEIHDRKRDELISPDRKAQREIG